jgi:hypothetical protein
MHCLSSVYSVTSCTCFELPDSTSSGGNNAYMRKLVRVVILSRLSAALVGMELAMHGQQNIKLLFAFGRALGPDQTPWLRVFVFFQAFQANKPPSLAKLWHACPKKKTRWKISLASRIHFFLNFLSFILPDQLLHTMKNTHTHTHTSDCVDIFTEIQRLAKYYWPCIYQTSSSIFFHLFCPTYFSTTPWRTHTHTHTWLRRHLYRNPEFSEVLLTVYLSRRRRPGGVWANTWHWTKCFTLSFSNRSRGSPIPFPRRPLL